MIEAVLESFWRWICLGRNEKGDKLPLQGNNISSEASNFTADNSEELT